MDDQFFKRILIIYLKESREFSRIVFSNPRLDRDPHLRPLKDLIQETIQFIRISKEPGTSSLRDNRLRRADSD